MARIEENSMKHKEDKGDLIIKARPSCMWIILNRLRAEFIALERK